MAKSHLNQVITSHLIEYQADRFPEKEILVFERGEYGEDVFTYGNLHIKGNRLARYLVEKGIKEGDTVAVFMYNRPETVFSFIATSTIGAIAVPIDPRSRGERLEYFFNFTEAKGIILSGETLNAFNEVKDRIKNLNFVAYAPQRDFPVEIENDYDNLGEILEENLPVVEQKIFDVNKIAQIIFTSGTTGNPKGVIIRHQRIGLYNILRQLAWKYKKDDVLYTGLSLSHANAQAVTLFPALYGGIKAVFSPKFTKSRIWDICRKYNCTTFSLLGGMAAGIFNEPEREDDSDNPVKVVVSAGMPKAIWRAFEERFNVKVHEWYGSAEGGFAHNPPGKGPIGSFGKPLPGIMEFKVVDENGNKLGPNKIGELIIRNLRGETKVEYLKNPEASAQKVRNGWMYTGDMVHYDEKGWFYFDFRKGTELRRAGDFVQPEYLEAVIGRHKDISEVCVIGIPAESGAPGESDIVAVIKLFDGVSPDAEAIFEYCKQNLESNFMPLYLWFVDEIPKTPSEKFLKRVLVERFSPDLNEVYRKN
ncbi:crotonobetaine/carnitine-CoA ligase [Thermotomaculum hydrothermale]|uniref:Crotonobetaine/carnitine-CoA ligase n=1 Tax=Thermotomaculum hydrothermale TaxID=981385 RepID=A0A7R6PPV0_9BACT|nr:AMP-binding protein [Thermotomaculum hydrothermale]BBB33623.1 crotonobetaine/carnitine-CoA ligase [Thermotomaculum hydrothermale]